MNPLPTSQRVMRWLSICTAEESASKRKRLCYAVCTVIAGFLGLAVLLTSAAYIINYVTIDLEGSLYAVFQVGAHSAIVNLTIVGFISRHRIATIFTELSKLYAANENESSYHFLIEANEKSEWLWRAYFKFGIMGFWLDLCISSAISIIYCFYTYDAFIVSHLYIPYIQYMPWNQNTPIGYFAEVAFSIGGGESYFFYNGSVVILFTSICWHHQAFYKRFCHAALKLDQPEHKHRANEILRDLLYFHITVKDWFLQTAEVYSPLVLIQLICNVIFMAAVVFELDLRLKNIDFGILLLIHAVPVGVSNIFIYCYFGKLATESYEKMGDFLYELNWRELSNDVQRKILPMIQNMQRPMYYHGFGVAVLNLETFIKIIRTILSYYMVFKTITAN